MDTELAIESGELLIKIENDKRRSYCKIKRSKRVNGN